jgi:transcriptional regulator
VPITSRCISSRRPARTGVLAIFHGPDSYISPNWYPTKKAHGKAVPTWNYAVVHAHGRLRVVDDPRWVRAQIEALTATQEHGSAHPWQVADAPDDYVEQLIRILVGLDIEITRLVGKTKASQNQPEVNRVGVAEALRGTGRTNDADMAALVERSDPNSR